VESATGSSRKSELAAALHRLRSTLARLKAELELAAVDGTGVPIERLHGDVNEALTLLRAIEEAALELVTVRVVDDDPRLAEITARGLRRLGYEADSQDNLRSLRAREIVVLDLSLATALDPDARNQLRRARPIVVTGATDAGSRALAASLGASDYLVKPVDLDELAASISRRMAEE
jgi:ActR/RegA family two-component response regulator